MDLTTVQPAQFHSFVLRETAPWSPQSHAHFPEKARARAVKLMLIGELLSREERFVEYGPQAVFDAWVGLVMPRAVLRTSTGTPIPEPPLLKRWQLIRALEHVLAPGHPLGDSVMYILLGLMVAIAYWTWELALYTVYIWEVFRPWEWVVGI